MQVKRYKAADMRRALELVRSDLGEDAVILSSNNTKKGVEILATADDCQQLLDSANSPEPIEQEKVNVFAKYESAAERESLAMLDDLSVETAGAGINDEQRRALVKAASADKSYLAEQLEKLSSQVSFPNKAGGISRKPHVVKAEKSRGAANGKNRSLVDALDSDTNFKNALQRASAGKQASSSSIEVVEDSDFSQSFDIASQLAEREATPSSKPANPMDEYFAARAKTKTSEKIAKQAQELPTSEPRNNQTQPEQTGDEQVAAVSVAPVAPVQNDRSQQQIEMLQSELSDMRALLEMQLTQTRFANLRGMQLACDRKLEQMGFGLHFRSDIHNQCDLAKESQQDKAWQKTIDYLTEQVKTVSCDLVNSGGQIAFIGPTGAGKTTTIAKLATRYVLDHGRESIALITVDNERLGSQSQLKSLAKILQIPLRSVASAKELPETLASLDYCRLVLIDTPGVTAAGIHSDPFMQQLFAMPEVTKLAVLACNAQHRFQKNLLTAMAGKHIRGAVLTKLDETDCVAETLDAVLTEQMPVAYTTDGQHIPNDISTADAGKLISLAQDAVGVKLADGSTTDDVSDLQKQSA